jgi:hypothetical protein
VSHTTIYRLVPILHPVTGDTVQGVEKVVISRDGTRQFEKQGKVVANSLGEFREAYPREKVEGAPTEENMKLDLAQMSDEQLAAMGVQRAAPVEEPGIEDIDIDAIFASVEAADFAHEKDMSMDLFPAGEGSGHEGRYTKKDVTNILLG